MVRFRLLIATVLCTVLAGPAAAQAAPKPDPLTLAAAVARQYWHATPCGGQVRVLAQQPVPALLHSDTDAWVTFGSSLGANDLSAPASTYLGCTIAFGRSRWPTTESMVQDWDMLCMTMTHEVGHLLGHPHDLTPGSVMAPVFTDYSGEPRLCRTSRPKATR